MRILNKDPDVVSEKASIIILNIKSAICMAENGKDTKQTIHISRKIHCLRNGEEWNLHKIVWCEVGLQLVVIGTKNVWEDELNPRFGYDTIMLVNFQNTCTIDVTGYRRFWRTMCSELLDLIDLSILFNEFEMFIWV